MHRVPIAFNASFSRSRFYPTRRHEKY